MNSIKLKIADIIIEFVSLFPFKRLTKKEKGYLAPGRYADALYQGCGRSQIVIDVCVVNELPGIKNAKTLFVTYHVEDGLENWRLLEAGKGYIYQSPVKDKKQVVFLNSSLNRARAYVLLKNGRWVWHISDLIYDFLQVLLIHYLAQRRLGFFIHAAGIKEGRRGFIFAGKSGSGKSTTARLWHRYSRAVILNDDRVIVRKFGKNFRIYGSPWHGEFGNYLADSKVSALPEKIFFISRSRSNNTRPLSLGEAFLRLYPALFPVFWDKACLHNITLLAQEALKRVPSFHFGFCKNKSAVDFIKFFP